jgi:peptide deformylase
MKLLTAPHLLLNTPVPEFNFTEHNAPQLEAAMIELMLQHGGIGLSANQIGLQAQIFVMKPYLIKRAPFAVINPQILSVSEQVESMPEGCLSEPGLFLSIARPVEITVKYVDTHAKECIITLHDIDARCWLHEFDHLNGIMFTDRVSKLKLQVAKRKQLKNKDKVW